MSDFERERLESVRERLGPVADQLKSKALDQGQSFAERGRELLKNAAAAMIDSASLGGTSPPPTPEARRRVYTSEGERDQMAATQADVHNERR